MHSLMPPQMALRDEGFAADGAAEGLLTTVSLEVNQELPFVFESFAAASNAALEGSLRPLLRVQPSKVPEEELPGSSDV